MNSATPIEIEQSRRELTAIPVEKRIEMRQAIGKLQRQLPALLDNMSDYIGHDYADVRTSTKSGGSDK